MLDVNSNIYDELRKTFGKKMIKEIEKFMQKNDLEFIKFRSFRSGYSNLYMQAWKNKEWPLPNFYENFELNLVIIVAKENKFYELIYIWKPEEDKDFEIKEIKLEEVEYEVSTFK